MTGLNKGLEKVSRKGLHGRTCLNEELKKVTRFLGSPGMTWLNEGLEKVSRYRFTWYDVLE